VPKPWSRNRERRIEADLRALEVRPGSTAKRDAYKVATAGLTGLTAFGALAVTGAVAGAAAHQKSIEDAARAAAQPPVPAPSAVAQRRPHHTVVRTRVVHEVSTPTVARPGTGGTVAASSSHTTVTQAVPKAAPQAAPRPAPRPAPKPAPAPAPKPAPKASAPSSGS